MDFNINEGKSMITNDAELVLQQIDILFDTTPREVLGAPDFGSEYDRYLYDMHITGDSLKAKVKSDLSSLDLKDFVPVVEVYMLQGSERDIALIDITLTKDYNTYRKTYKIS
jgi:hypothetical protein